MRRKLQSNHWVGGPMKQVIRKHALLLLSLYCDELAEWWVRRVMNQPSDESAEMNPPWWIRRVMRCPGIGANGFFHAKKTGNGKTRSFRFVSIFALFPALEMDYFIDLVRAPSLPTPSDPMLKILDIFGFLSAEIWLWSIWPPSEKGL